MLQLILKNTQVSLLLRLKVMVMQANNTNEENLIIY